MSCRETPRTSPKCTCCDHSLGTSNRSCCTREDQHSPRSPKNDAYYKNYAVPDDDECCLREINGRGRWNHIRTNQNGRIDPSTLKTFSDLRRRACTLIDSSSGSSEGCPCSGCNKKERNEDSINIIKRAQNLSYSPQSNFLKKMRRQQEGLFAQNGDLSSPCGCSFCGSNQSDYRPVPSCQCCQCCKGKTDSPSPAPVPERPNFRDRGGPWSDVSSLHDRCTCFRTLRAKSCEGEFTGYQIDGVGREGGTDFYSSQMFVQSLANNNCDVNQNEPGGKSPHKKKGKSEHVSRSDKRKRRKGSRRRRGNESRRRSLDLNFEPSLKRPHPNSCERCWRYASPSRSPVNRPSQRFDPNYRRSHSQINVSEKGQAKDASSVGNRESRSRLVQYDPETKVHELMHTGERSPKRAKSADSIKKPKDVKCVPAGSAKEKKSPRGKGAPGKTQPKNDEADSGVGRTSKSKTTPPKGQGQMKSCVCFEDESKGTPRNTKPPPVQCSPSMFEKSSQKSSSAKKNPSRPQTVGSPEIDKGKNNSKKQRSSSASQTEPMQNVPFLPKPRALSFGRDQRNLGDFKENCFPFGSLKTCCCHGRSTDDSSPPQGRGGMAFEKTSPRGNSYQSGRTGSPSPKCRPRESLDQNNKTYPNACTCCGERTKQPEASPDAWNCGCCFSYKSIDPNGSPRSWSRGEGRSNGGRRNIPVFSALTSDYSPRKSPNGVTKYEQFQRVSNGCERRTEARPNVKNKIGASDLNNPRKYCVFYMNKSRENRNDDVEVLIEELTQGKGWKESRSEALIDKMNKLQEHRLDSMALRFQKGVVDKCKKQQQNNRVLYF